MPAAAQQTSLPLTPRVDKLEKEMRAVQRKVFPGANPQYFDAEIAPPTAAPSADGTPATSPIRSEEHTSELQSLMRISYAVFCLKKKKTPHPQHPQPRNQ